MFYQHKKIQSLKKTIEKKISPKKKKNIRKFSINTLGDAPVILATHRNLVMSFMSIWVLFFIFIILGETCLDGS